MVGHTEMQSGNNVDGEWVVIPQGSLLPTHSSRKTLPLDGSTTETASLAGEPRVQTYEPVVNILQLNQSKQY